MLPLEANSHHQRHQNYEFHRKNAIHFQAAPDTNAPYVLPPHTTPPFFALLSKRSATKVSRPFIAKC